MVGSDVWILFGICIEINVFLEKGCFVCYINDILLGIFY